MHSPHLQPSVQDTIPHTLQFTQFSTTFKELADEQGLAQTRKANTIKRWEQDNNIKEYMQHNSSDNKDINKVGKHQNNYKYCGHVTH